jgi:hypothetical protein
LATKPKYHRRDGNHRKQDRRGGKTGGRLALPAAFALEQRVERHAKEARDEFEPAASDSVPYDATGIHPDFAQVSGQQAVTAQCGWKERAFDVIDMGQVGRDHREDSRASAQSLKRLHFLVDPMAARRGGTAEHHERFALNQRFLDSIRQVATARQIGPVSKNRVQLRGIGPNGPAGRPLGVRYRSSDLCSCPAAALSCRL